MSLELELRRVLSKHLFNVDHISREELIRLAETACAIEYNPEFYFRQALAIVEGQGIVSSKELTLGAKLIKKGCEEQEADIAQAEIGQILGRIYRDGDEDLEIAPDLRKAGQYGRSPDALPPSKKSTEFAYKGFLWFTRFRLFLVRADRIFKDFNHPILAFPFLSVTAALGGLSYFGEFLVDCGVLFKAAFFPSKAQRIQTPGLWNRVKHTFYKGDRPYRMANVRWGIGNLLSFLGCFIPPITAAMNLSLFASDLIEDHIKYKRDQKKPQELLKEIAAAKDNLKLEIKQLKKVRENLQATMQTAISDLREYKHIEANIHDIEKQLQTKHQQLKFQTATETKLIKQREADLKKRKRLRYVSAAIFLGMAILLVPQFFGPAIILSALAVKITAACIAMSGSVAGGLVRGVYDEYKSKKSRKSEIEIIVSDKPQLRKHKISRKERNQIIELTPQKLSEAARHGVKQHLFYKKEFSKSAPLITGKVLLKAKPLIPKNLTAPVLGSQPIAIPAQKVAPQRQLNFCVGSDSKMEHRPTKESGYKDEDQSGLSFIDNSNSFFKPLSISKPVPSLPSTSSFDSTPNFSPTIMKPAPTRIPRSPAFSPYFSPVVYKPEPAFHTAQAHAVLAC